MNEVLASFIYLILIFITMKNAIEMLRPFDFVILKGVSKEGRPYHFAKFDSRTQVTNNPEFLKALEEAGTRVIEINK